MSWAAVNYGFWDPWLDPIKVTFDGERRLILINDGESSIDVQTDLYSAWKRWVVRDDNFKFAQAFKAIGGDPINETNVITPYFFLTNGWRVRPYEGDHVLNINGILLTDDNQDPLVPTEQKWNISVTKIVPVKAESIGVSAPTADENALAVWNFLRSLVTDPSTMGGKLGSLQNTTLPTTYPLSTEDKQDIADRVPEVVLPSTYPLSSEDKQDIARKVWNQSSDEVYDPGSFGEFFKNWFNFKLLTVKKFLALK